MCETEESLQHNADPNRARLELNPCHGDHHTHTNLVPPQLIV
jgi:hypothetical protein